MGRHRRHLEITPDREDTEVRFTHRDLVPEFECFEACSSAWGFYVNGSLKRLITTLAWRSRPLHRRPDGCPAGERGGRVSPAVAVLARQERCLLAAASGGSRILLR